jgi:hypothetical protein
MPMDASGWVTAAERESMNGKGLVDCFDSFGGDNVARSLQLDEFLGLDFWWDVLDSVFDGPRLQILKAATETLAYGDEIARL